MFVTSVLPYISRSIFSLFLSSFFLYRCVCNLFHRTPFFPSFFLFFFFASLFSTDKQCIVEMKIGCTAALRESLINSWLSADPISRYTRQAGWKRLEERMEREKERGEVRFYPDCWCYRFVIFERYFSWKVARVVGAQEIISARWWRWRCIDC